LDRGTGACNEQRNLLYPTPNRRAIGPAADGQRNPLMSEDHPVTLDFIAAQLQRVLSEIRILRDDVDVLAAIVRRLDNNQALMLDELRAMHAQQQRTAARVRALEERST
jgi:hypothetical protein